MNYENVSIVIENQNQTAECKKKAFTQQVNREIRDVSG